jgi:hypothetical protein
MNTTELVAVIGAISTPAVAIAGYVFNERRVREDRKSTRDLSVESHRHERELAEAARAHERQLRVGERLYDDKKETYRVVLTWALRAIQQVEEMASSIRDGDVPAEAEAAPDVVFNHMMVQVNAFGSPEVAEALESFFATFKRFAAAVASIRMAPAKAAEQASRARVRGARVEARVAYEGLTARIRDELANL